MVQRWYQEYCKFCRISYSPIDEGLLSVSRFAAGYHDDNYVIVIDGTPAKAAAIVLTGGAGVDAPDIYICHYRRQARLRRHFAPGSKASESVLRDLTVKLVVAHSSVKG